jgi:2-oxoglutarate ferredoxin oxidoreductase subunit alpha
MGKKSEILEREAVVIRFSGDSGDGMQLTGTLFSDTAALFGNDISTFPDYPAEIVPPREQSEAYRVFRCIWDTQR